MFGIYLIVALLFLAFATHQFFGWLYIERPEKKRREEEERKEKSLQDAIKWHKEAVEFWRPKLQMEPIENAENENV